MSMCPGDTGKASANATTCSASIANCPAAIRRQKGHIVPILHRWRDGGRARIGSVRSRPSGVVDENIPLLPAVHAIRAAGHDIATVVEETPGASNEPSLGRSHVSC